MIGGLDDVDLFVSRAAAEVLGCSVGTVKSQVSRGRSRLALALH